MMKNTIANFAGLKKQTIVLVVLVVAGVWSTSLLANVKRGSHNNIRKAGEQTANARLAPHQKYEIDYANSKVEFVSYTFLFRVFGTFNKWTLAVAGDPDHLDKVRGSLVIDTASLDTGIDARDKHLRGNEFFDCSRYPKAVFELNKIAVEKAGASKNGSVPLKLTGLLSFRGIKSEITFDATFDKNDEGRSYQVMGTAILDRQAWGIHYTAKFPLPSIKDRVDVKFRLQFKPVHPLDR
jgi:polyisoprenoid-binding protein YceI